MADDAELLLDCGRFRVVRQPYKDASGARRERDVIRHPGAVVILPLLDDGRVCLIQNRRVAVDDTLIELPAGTLDVAEPPEACAHRELAEETGYRATGMEHLHTFFLSPGILNERMHLFLATGLTPGDTALEPDEQIENLIVDWEVALAMIDEGKICDAKTMVGLLYYDRIT